MDCLISVSIFAKIKKDRQSQPWHGNRMPGEEIAELKYRKDGKSFYGKDYF